jgi:hypothetical protein
MPKERNNSVVNARLGPSLRNLKFSPDVNPLMLPTQISIKRRFVSTGRNSELVDPKTGVTQAVSMIRQVEEKDDKEFVKVFSDGIKAAYGLSRTAARVFQVVLDEYEKTPMNGGYADAIYLAWFGEGLSGRDVGMTDRTFQTGLRELLAKGFLAARSPNLFWVNANLFFKGDRVLFVKEYQRRKQPAAIDRSVVPPVDTDRLAKLDDEIRAQTMIERARAELLAKRNAL